MKCLILHPCPYAITTSLTAWCAVKIPKFFFFIPDHQITYYNTSRFGYEILIIYFMYTKFE